MPRQIHRTQAITKLRQIAAQVQTLKESLAVAAYSGGLATWAGEGGDAYVTAEALADVQYKLESMAYGLGKED